MTIGIDIEETKRCLNWMVQNVDNQDAYLMGDALAIIEQQQAEIKQFNDKESHYKRLSHHWARIKDVDDENKRLIEKIEQQQEKIEQQQEKIRYLKSVNESLESVIIAKEASENQK